AQWRRMPAWDVPLDPRIGAQVVERGPRWGETGVGRGEPSLPHPLSQERRERLEVPGQLLRAVKAIAEIHEAGRPAGAALIEGDGAEAEARDELVDDRMVAVYEFTAPLADHAIRPGARIGVHATADAIGR